jgi:hypothetical protein
LLKFCGICVSDVDCIPVQCGKKQKIEPSKEKSKMLHCFEINFICSSLGVGWNFEHLFGIEESERCS